MKRLVPLLLLLCLTLCGCGISLDEYNKAVDAAYDKGFSAGRDNGYIDGYEKGFNDAIGIGSGGDRQTTPPAPTFIANKSSKVYHQPDCASVDQISDENRLEWYGTEEEIQTAGFTAHSTCSGKVPSTDYDLDDVDFIETPDSTAFTQIGRNPDTGDVVVQFKESGAYYVYYDVPGEVWDDFESADSKGSYYNMEIKGNYDCEKIEQ